ACEVIDSQKMILGVGTTVTRTIEYYARTKQNQGLCDLFLDPHNPPLRQDYLLTNFHLPKSTLIMLGSAFIGRQNGLKLYDIAIKEKYRFYSYGDA
ncbi:S-adenosylmethionine:tRNA ribosyltransferase-isomerase, partial [Campylobacter coli]|uniref:S-adenosylmethionine:tRNA ribosyltransferase-isomerase n=1 Tax=Campylobacter coli TaxID=195 RepID=UPI0025B1E29F